MVAERTRRDENIRKLNDMVNDGDTKRTKQEQWNVIIARTCEDYNSVEYPTPGVRECDLEHLHLMLTLSWTISHLRNQEHHLNGRCHRS